MPKKIFNSKIASDPSDSGGFGGLDDYLSDYMQIVNPETETRHVDEFGDEIESPEESSRRKSPKFQQIRTVAPELPARDPHYTNEPLLVDPITGEDKRNEEIRINPQEVATRMHPIVEHNKKRTEQLGELKSKATPRFPEYKDRMNLPDATLEQSNIIGRRIIQAKHAIMDEAARQTHACPTCQGQTKIIIPGQEGNAKICSNCLNHGHTQLNPEKTLFNIRKVAKEYNTAIDFHDNHCATKACNKACAFKDDIDKLVRRPYYSEAGTLQGLTRHQTHARTGSDKNGEKSPEWLVEKMRRRGVNDKYQPLAEAYQTLGGRGSDPIKKFDLITPINHNLIDPDKVRHYAEGYNPHELRDLFQAGIFNPTGGGRDKQMFGVVRGEGQREGTSNIIYTMRPTSAMKSEEYERTIGRPDREIKSARSADAFDFSAMNEKDSRLRKFLSESYDDILPMYGKRSPAGGLIHRTLRDVPNDFLARVSPITAPLVATAGVVTKTVPLRNLEGFYPYRKRPLTPTKMNSMVKANIVNRVATGISTNELRRAYTDATDPLTREHIRSLAHDAHDILDLSRHHAWSLIPEQPGREDSYSPTKKLLLPTEPGGKFNSSALDFKPDDYEVPTGTVPDAIDMVSTSEGKKNILNQVAEAMGRDTSKGHGFTGQQADHILDSYKAAGHIRGGLAAVGVDDNDEEEPEDTQIV